MYRLTIGACSIVALLALAPAASAEFIMPGGGITGSSTYVTPEGITFFAMGGVFTFVPKCAGCPTGLGIDGGPSDVNGNEISGSEFLRIVFPTAVNVDTLYLAYVYPQNIWDSYNETIGIGLNGVDSYTMTATGINAGTGNQPNVTVQNLQTADLTHGGLWAVHFAPGAGPVQVLDLKVTGFTGIPTACNMVASTNCSDFQFAGIDVSPAGVPEPATFALLGSALLALVALRRRR